MIQQAASEILTYRPPGAPPLANDPVAAAAAFVNVSQRESSRRKPEERVDEYIEEFEEVMKKVAEEDEGWYFKDCKHPGCNYVTWRSRDVNAMTGIIADIDYHRKIAHPEVKDSGNSGRGREAFLEATKLITIPEGMDNRTSVLHPARTLPLPLDHKAAVKISPLTAPGGYCYIDFSHLGFNIGNGRVVLALHDRTFQGLKLQSFSETNLSKRDDDRMKMKGPEKYDEEELVNLRSVGEAVRCIGRYEVIYSFLHPLDWAARAIRQLVEEKNAIGCIGHSDVLARFFASVTMENGARAARNELPLTVPELRIKWDQSSAGPSGQTDMISEIRSLKRDLKELKNQSQNPNRKYVQAGQRAMEPHGPTQGYYTQEHNAQFQQGPPYGQFQQYKRAAQGPPRMPDNKRRMGVGGFCVDFNTVRGCPNQPTPTGCVKEGREMRHGCTFIVDGKFCDRVDHNKHTHGN